MSSLSKLVEETERADFADFQANPEQVGLFISQFALLLKSGIGLLDALQSVSEGFDGDLAAAGRVLIRRVCSGHTLSTSLALFPRIFPRVCVAMAEVGESTGSLSPSLEQAAAWLLKERDLQKKVRTALTYPVTVLVVTVLANFLVFKISLPQMFSMLDSLGVDPPLLTRLVFGLGAILTSKFTILTLAVAGAVLYWNWDKIFSPRARNGVARVAHKTPILGRLLRATALARVATTLAVTQRLGLTVHAGFRLAAASADDPLYKARIETVVDSVIGGETLAEALERHRDLFPPVFTQTVMVGHEVGNLAGTLEKLSKMLELEVDGLVDALAAGLEPLLLGFCSCIAGLFILATVLPLQEFMSRLL